MSTFPLPDLGEGLQEAEIVAWHVGVGDHVVADQPLLSVETDKAVVEVPSPQSGRIAQLFAKTGDIVQVGSPLVEFASTASADSGTVVGSMTVQAVHARGERDPKPAGAGPSARAGAAQARVRATPAVRALARRLGVDLAQVVPSGPEGAILTADVQRAAAGASERSPAVPDGPATSAAARPEPDQPVEAAAVADSTPESTDESAAEDTEAARLEPLRGVRRAMAANMERAHAEVVPATVTEEADIHGWRGGGDVTLRLARAVVAGCLAEPALNAWYLGRDQGRRLHDKVDLGLAMDTEDGLFVPVLRDVGRRSAEDLRHGLTRMKADVQARSVPPEELRGQTITLSNFGMFGGRHASLVVLPPQVAILGAGRASERAVARNGAIAARRVLPLSLTFDHRAVMGGEAARFLAAVVADLERPE